MQIILKPFLVLFWSYILFAQVPQLKTVSESNPEKGIFFKQFIDTKTPLAINLLEIDLKNPQLDLIAATAFDSIAGNQEVSAMINTKLKQDQNILAAINADFYEKGGYSTNALVIDGQFVQMPNKGYTAIGFDKSNSPFISKISFESNLFIKGKERKLNGVNKTRDTNNLILYNKYYGSSSATNQWGTEVSLKQIKKSTINDTLYFIAGKKQNGQGNMIIQKGNYVLSGHDKGALFLNNHISSGDTIKIFIGLLGMPPLLDDLVGGFTQLVKNGFNIAIESYDKVGNNRENFVIKRHPRTAIGFNKAKTKLYMVTVDGRQPSSIGISLPDLADLMIKFGAYSALNLDGGGSTTMVVDGHIVNSPSDPTGERAVSNALMVRLRTH